jgi:toxin FitB
VFIVDTNVVSEIRRGPQGHPKVLAWAAAVPTKDTYLSAITVLELERGALRLARKDATRAGIISDWLHHQILPRFAGRILPIDERVALSCARLHVPTTRAERDAWIAATAIVHSMTVVTRNVGDFKIGGVKVFDPWG